MINWLIGSSGGGKSYEANRYHILAALEKGRHVITNLPVKKDFYVSINPDFERLLHIRKSAQPIRGEFVIVDETPEFRLWPDGITQSPPKHQRPFAGVWDYYFTDDMRTEKGQGPLFVIDECHFALPRGKTQEDVDDWFSVHRHFNSDVLLITQSYGKVSKNICDNTQLVYRVRKATAFGKSDAYIRKVMDGFRGDVVNTSIRSYESFYFGLYKSHTQGQSVEEFGADDVTPIWMRWPFIGTGICALILILMFVFIDFKNPMDANSYTKTKAKAKPTPEETLAVAKDSYAKSQQAKKEQPAVTQAAIKPNTQPLPEQPQQAQEVPTDHDPYEKNGIHLLGHVSSKTKPTLWLITLSQNGARIKNLSAQELVKVGYQFEPIGDCAAWLTYKTVKRFITCDTPSVTVNSAISAQS
jgi:zona occludens toxin